MSDAPDEAIDPDDDAAPDADESSAEWEAAPGELAGDVDRDMADLDDRPIVVSAFAGIGGFDLGFARAGFQTGVVIEWDAKASKVLAVRFPRAARFGDVRKVDGDAVRRALGGRRVAVLCGGFPCQDLSVAGRRAGLAGERSGLYGELLRLARELDPEWLVVENVPGLLSSEDGDDFCTFLGDVTGFYPDVPRGGWRSSGVCHGPRATAAWRVLDARHFGVAQRRRRVFVVVSARDRSAPAAILLEPEGLRGDPAARVPSWTGAAAAAVGAAVARRVPGARRDRAGDAAPTVDPGVDTVSTLQGGGSRGWRVGAEEAAGGQLVPLATNSLDGDVARALVASGAADPHDYSQSTYVAVGSVQAHGGPDLSPTVTSKWAKGRGGPAGSETGNLVVGVDTYNQALTGDVAPTIRRGEDHSSSGPEVPHVLVGGHYGDAVAHTVTASGTDGMGRGVPIIGQQYETGIREEVERRLAEGGAIAFDWQAGGTADESWGGKARSWIVKRGDYAGALSTTKVQAVLDGRDLPSSADPLDPPPVTSVTGEQTHALTAEGHDASEDGTGRGTPIVNYAPDQAATLTAGSRSAGVSAPGRRHEDDHNLVAVRHYRKGKRAQTNTDDETWVEDDYANTLNLNDVGDTRAVDIVVDEPAVGTFMVEPETGQGADLRARPVDHSPATADARQTERGIRVAGSAAVRRLTPRECERLQGFPPVLTPADPADADLLADLGCIPLGDGTWAAPDFRVAATIVELADVTVQDWTDVDGASDSARYKQLGNAVCASVSEWVACRIHDHMDGLLTP